MKKQLTQEHKQINFFELTLPHFKFTHRPIKLFEAFAGIGCQAMALNRLGIEYETVGISEIDKYAITSYNAIHGKTKNYGDICKMTHIPECDIFTWSFPCTDLSKAGKREGLQGGTRSGLVYEVLRLLQVSKPKVLIMENVPDLIQASFVSEFAEIRRELEELGYSNYVERLNAKDYGVAQNRDRVFMVSILGEWYYEFPSGVKLEKRLKDYLEDEVDEKYFLSDKMLKGMQETNFNTYSLENKLQEQDGVSATILARFEGAPQVIAIPEATKKGYSLASDGDGIYINRPYQKRGVVQKGMIQTLKTSGDDVGVVIEENNILTLNNIFDLCGIIDSKEGVKYERSKPLLRILWQEIGKKEIQQAIRRLYSVYKKEILQPNLYEESVSKDREQSKSNLYERSHNSENDKQIGSKKDNLRNMWEQFKCRYTPQRWELEEQQFRQLDMFMQELPYEVAQKEVNLQNLWETDEGFRLLQQTLYSLQEIWRPTLSQKQSKMRIRKLCPIEVWRLMGISDEDFDKASKVVSNSQLYKQAGNGIVVDVFAAILRGLFL